MADDLAGHTARLSQTQTVDHVVQTQLEQRHHVLTGGAFHIGSLQVVVIELLLQHTIDKLHLLLFLQLGAIFRHLAATVAIGVALGLLVRIAHDRRRNIKAPAFPGDRLFVNCH